MTDHLVCIRLQDGRFRPPVIRVVVLLAVLLCCGRAATGGLPRAEPEEAGMSGERLAEIDQAVNEALAARKMPGCVVLIARHGKVVFLRAYGHRDREPMESPMTTDTLFDLASLTKPIATATSVALLVEQGKLALDQPVAKHLPEFAQNGKESITIRHLLTHQGGLIADNDIHDYADGPEKAIERTLATTPRAAPGETFVYSDVGFIALGELVRRVSGQALDRFAAEHIFQPLGLAETGYLPAEELCRRAAPTEKRDGRWMQGEVHDPRAFALGGVAGHAGLFSTAEELAVYAQMLLDGGQLGGVRLLKPETVAEMTTPQKVRGGWRALGWDMRTGYSSNRGSNFSDRAFGHGGFTGTSLWIDPELDLTVIFLSNRVHPDGKGLVNPLAGRIGTISAEAIVRESANGLPTTFQSQN
ncbi:MAG TPA: serine hydrolase domain-containing protein [Pirellulales bacterium]|nr:serine hydrolase domain-containing protein [Pirellulales bacterium]